MNKHVVILGAGLSGLSAAWFLKQRGVDVTLIEKTSRVGGWVRTVEQEDFLFEQGPHSCRPYGAGATLRLIEGLGLQPHVICASLDASKRYLYYQQQLQLVPNGWNMWRSPLMRGMLSALWRDLRVKKQQREDESISTFMRRHIGDALTDRFVDPLVSGIYAGNMDQLSMAACFPTFFEWEKHYGSLFKGACFAPRFKEKQTPFAKQMSKRGIFSFKQGMETLTATLEKALSSSLKLSTEAVDLHFDRDGVDVQLATGDSVHADHLISALPAKALLKLLPTLGASLTKIPSTSVVVVNLGYRGNRLKFPGFGHLVPMQEQEEILGAIWDSSIFPEQNRGEMTRIAVMMGGAHRPWQCTLPRQQQIEIALRAVAKQLQIDVQPDAVCVTVAQEAIPQYPVGHLQLLNQLMHHAASISPRLSLIGSHFHGVSVNDCIAYAENCTLQIAK